MVFVAVDGLILVSGMTLFLLALLGISAVVSEQFDDIMIYLVAEVPGFGYKGIESGNALFDTYTQLR